MNRKLTLNTNATLTPAYNRDYKSRVDVIEAFRGKHDFKYINGTDCGYVSITDYKAGDFVKLRYNGLKNVSFYTVTEHDIRKYRRG